MHGVDTFVELLSCLVCQFTMSFHTLLLHDKLCHKTMEKYEDFEEMEISLIHPLKFAIQTWFRNCPQISLLTSH